MAQDMELNSMGNGHRPSKVALSVEPDGLFCHLLQNMLHVPLILNGSITTGCLYGCGCQNQWYHLGVGAPPILEPIFVGVGMFTGGTIWLLTHGHILFQKSDWENLVTDATDTDSAPGQVQDLIRAPDSLRTAERRESLRPEGAVSIARARQLFQGMRLLPSRRSSPEFFQNQPPAIGGTSFAFLLFCRRRS